MPPQITTIGISLSLQIGYSVVEGDTNVRFRPDDFRLRDQNERIKNGIWN